MTFSRLFVVVIILLLTNMVAAAPKKIKNNHWEGKTTQGFCKVEKKAVKTAIKDALEQNLTKASLDLVSSAKTRYRNCLREVFFKALTKKVKALKFEHLHIGYLSNGELVVVKKVDLLEDEKFVNRLYASGEYLHNDELKDATLMAKTYHHRKAIDDLKAKIVDLEMLKRVSK